MPKVLIVEDTFIVATHIKMFLERNNYEVVEILSQGEAVLDAVQKLSPDIVLMDITLEGKMSGIEAAQQIREKTMTPIIFMSALSDPKSVILINEISNSTQVGKPFNDNDLLIIIKELLVKEPPPI